MKYLIVFLAIFISPSLSAIENNYETELSNIISNGHWKENDLEGYYRFITKTYGSEHVHSKLFVQWITLHEDGVRESKIIKEVGIKELNSNYYSFNSPLCSGGWKCSSYKLKATHSFSLKNVEFTLQFPSIGSYSINEKAL